MKPEEIAREWIDRKLEDAGWHVINRDDFRPDSSAVAVRETLLRCNLEADYVLFLNGKAAAVVEAKRTEVKLDNLKLIDQAENYTLKLPSWCSYHEFPIKLIFLSNGREIAFKDCHDNDPQYQLIEDFPKPKEVVQLLGMNGDFDGLPYLSPMGLRDCQYKAITALEKSFKEGKKRAALVLATGSGKTYLACMFAYRMLTYTSMNRILFLVDRNNLGIAAQTEFQLFRLTESRNLFSEIYGVERLSNNKVQRSSHVVIGTIQRLYSQLTGDVSTDPEDESKDEFYDPDGNVIEIPENPKLPSDFFDLIIIDECHRSIYSKWQKVLRYFKDAWLVGMTATPIPETEAFFDRNIVYTYSLEQSAEDGVNVLPGPIYRIKTVLGEHGGVISVGDKLQVTNKSDLQRRQQLATSERVFDKSELNRNIVVKDQLRKVLQAYKNAVYLKLYPDREPNFDYLPKTLIFAMNDLHAQNIVEVAKEVFKRTDDRFVQKITYSVGNSDERIKSFRNDIDFRIAVTVTLVATGTDVKPLEVLIFLNDVHSEPLYNQMIGRGVRTIDPESLREVTPNAESKDLFYIIDAIGVTESFKVVPEAGKGLGSKGITLRELLERLSHGFVPDEYLELLARKLRRIGNSAYTEDLDDLYKIFPISLSDFSNEIFARLQKGDLPPFESPGPENVERLNLISPLILNVPARKKLIEIAIGYVKEIEDKIDELIEDDFSIKSKENARRATEAFERYIRSHETEIEALRLIYNHNDGQLTRAMIDDLRQKLAEDLPAFGVRQLWSDYYILTPKKVTPLSIEDKEAVTNLIQLVRFAYHMTESLQSLPSQVGRNFELWCGQKQRELSLTDEQKGLLKEIAGYIAHNGSASFSSLKKRQDYRSGLLRVFKSIDVVNDQLYSLSKFILRAV